MTAVVNSRKDPYLSGVYAPVTVERDAVIVEVADTVSVRDPRVLVTVLVRPNLFPAPPFTRTLVPESLVDHVNDEDLLAV